MEKLMSVFARLAFVACLGLTFLAGNRADAQAAEPIKVTISTGDWIGYAPWYVAMAKGFDVAHGVKIEAVVIATSADVTSALGQGRLDTAHGLITTALQRQAAGVEFTIPLFLDISTTGDALIAGGDFKSIKDLVGKKIALVRDSGREYLLRLALKKAGLGIDDVQIVDVNTDELAGIAFVSGQVDAAVTFEPYISNAKSHKPDTRLISTAGEFPGVVADLWFVGKKFATEHPEAVIGLLRAWDDAVKFTRENTDEALKLAAEKAGGEFEDVKNAYSTIELYDLKQSQAFLEKNIKPMAAQIESMMREFGGLKGDVDFNALIDVESAKKALAK